LTTPATSPYLSLRRAVRPAIFARQLLAGDAERAGTLAAECEELLLLTRGLLKAAGHARILAPEPGPEPGPELGADEHGADRHARFLDAYADAGMAWAKVVGSSMALGRALLAAGATEDARRLAGFLAAAGEESAAADLQAELAQAVLAAHQEQLKGISNKMPPEEIEKSIKALRAILLEVPKDLNREVNRLLVPLAASIHAIMRQRDIEIPYTSRVEHIAAGGVAKYPDIVTISLDEIAAEFEGLC
jgi:plasmid stabilization system protein ParE